MTCVEDGRGTYRIRASVAAVLGLLLLLVSCGSDEQEPEPVPIAIEAPEPTATTAPVAAEATEPTTSTAPATGEPDPSPPDESSATTTSSSAAPGEYQPVFEPDSCPFIAPPGTDPSCGYLIVPENRDLPSVRQVRIAVAVFPARSAETHPPLLYLEGGPGGEALETIDFAYDDLATLNEGRTLVVFDQRGVGYSEPALSCPEMMILGFDLLDEQLTSEEEFARQTAVLDDCRGRWMDGGVDLSRYNSADSAADVADLRVVLGYDEWDLYGVSYGTRLALTVMRDHPQGVRSVILDSTYPPEVDGVATILPNAAAALDELFSACAADPVCSSTYGDLESEFFSVIEQLDASPAEIWVVDPVNFEGYPALLDGDLFLSVVFQSMYSDAVIPSLPQLIADTRDGNYFAAQSLVSLLLANQAFFSIGMFLSVECNEEVPFSDPANVQSAKEAHPRLAALVDGELAQSEVAFEFCRAWGAGTADPIEGQPVVSDIPTLVLAGRFDPITPPEFGRIAADNLSNSWFIEYPTLSHGVAFVEGCPLAVTLAFLDDPYEEPDPACVPEMPEMAFSVFGPATEIELVEDQVEGYRVLVPEGWQGEEGFYQRGSSIHDSTLLFVIPGPSAFGEMILLSVSQTYTGIEIEELAELAVGNNYWRRFSALAGSVSVEAALLDESIMSAIIVLVSDTREAAHLVDRVLIPAIESFDVSRV